jgi:predicted alpha/beta superfamily hydrolase
MNNIRWLSLLFSAFVSINTAWSQNPKVQLPGTQVIRFKSAINGHGYELPGSYSDTAKRYPVLYALDGEWEFPLVTAIHSALCGDGFIPEMIIVGVGWPDNFETNRMRDFTSSSLKEDSSSGGASKFMSVIKNEVMKLIDSNFRSDKKNNIIYGGSLGGYFALYSLFHDPTLFNGYVVCSPSLQWDNEVTFKFEKEFAEKNHVLNVKMLISSSGTEEELNPMSDFKKFIHQLRASKYTGLELDTIVVEKMSHSSEGPYALGRGLQFVFSKPDLMIDTVELDRYVGDYDKNWHITRSGGSLYINAFGGKAKLRAASNESFYVRGMPVTCEFKKDAQDKVTGLDLAFFTDKTTFFKKRF